MTDIAILGLGTVGNGVYRVISENGAQIARHLGGSLNIKYVLDLRTFEGHPLAGAVTKDFDRILADPSVRVVVETMGGLHPAFEYSKAALEAGKNVVTSNKAVVEAFGTELSDTAKRHGVFYLYEASVGGGIPLISTLHGSFGANEIIRIAGILNGTTNFILARMKKDGADFESALSVARERVYAERDPSADIDGYDTARKICILATIASGRRVSLSDCAVIEGIRAVRREHIEAASALGFVIKLLGVFEDGCVFVAPHLVPCDSILGAVDEVFNAVSITGSAVGEVMLYGQGAGAMPTASAIVSDIIESINGTCPPIDGYDGAKPVSKIMSPSRRFVFLPAGCSFTPPEGAPSVRINGCTAFVAEAGFDTDSVAGIDGAFVCRVLDPKEV